ncbi:hypothetical protein [Thiohalomonas denitrificans]|uniref:hypothetical protein n=1 Tax=Thiohalomonas denitrificans TaxID=415747 RepID=UPI0026F20734|nr:hypothetical protein [Thiohalomonas denitrificans]
MNAEANNRGPSLLIGLLSGIAILLLVLLVSNPFSSEPPNSAPVWWVSLTAPQYPESAFPDGIRIQFHVDGVFNGCQKVESEETYEEESLNCKHEMDAINHYVGMYPIAAGAPVERLFAPFVFTLLGLMIVVFALPGRKFRVAVLAIGSIGIAIWMSAAVYSEGGVNLLTESYVYDMSSTMDLDPVDYESWTGLEAMEESYTEALGRYFRNPEVIKQRTALMTTATHAVYGFLLAAMAVLIIGVWKTRFFYWLLIAVPILLPVFFIIDYAGWLWWFGHNLNAMGAFTVKPFMPTVFGQGKVAQFFTHSYPDWGFGLMVLQSFLLAVAALLRRKQTKEAGAAI